jgi:hypothetical protein
MTLVGIYNPSQSFETKTLLLLSKLNSYLSALVPYVWMEGE